MDFLRRIERFSCPFGILGYGMSGQAAEKLLLAAGVHASQILVFDHKRKDLRCLGTEIFDERDFFSSAQTLCVSPGIPLEQKAIQDFQKSGRKVTSELELAASFLTDEKIIGVTGSIGKSTLAALLAEGIKSFTTVFLGGNFGVPFAAYAERKLKAGEKKQWIVLELSSYQLENFANLRADASAFVYLTANHLERYTSKQDYYQAKWFLAERTVGPIIVNSASEELVEFCRKQTQAVVATSAHDPEFDATFYQNARLIGAHNQDLLAVVEKLGQILNWPGEFRKPLIEFPGLPHRLENCGVHDGIRWINDSKATALPAVRVAVESALVTISSGGTLHILLGGRDKNLPWEELASLANLSSAKLRFFFFGESRKLIQKKSGLAGAPYETCKNAILAAKAAAQAGDTILLSPGGTSLDEFTSFEQRGNFFKSLVGLTK